MFPLLPCVGRAKRHGTQRHVGARASETRSVWGSVPAREDASNRRGNRARQNTCPPSRSARRHRHVRYSGPTHQAAARPHPCRSSGRSRYIGGATDVGDQSIIVGAVADTGPFSLVDLSRADGRTGRRCQDAPSRRTQRHTGRASCTRLVRAHVEDSPGKSFSCRQTI